MKKIYRYSTFQSELKHGFCPLRMDTFHKRKNCSQKKELFIPFIVILQKTLNYSETTERKAMVNKSWWFDAVSIVSCVLNMIRTLTFKRGAHYCHSIVMSTTFLRILFHFLSKYLYCGCLFVLPWSYSQYHDHWCMISKGHDNINIYRLKDRCQLENSLHLCFLVHD